MKKSALFVIFLFLWISFGYAGLLDDVKQQAGILGQAAVPGQGGVDNDTAVSGLKEALAIGTENAVKSLSQIDGYFGNSLVKILMPDKIQNVADVLGKAGFQKHVDDFVLSMNRAAEKAAPEAASIFGDAIRQMSVQDATGIVNGGDTAATDYFKTTTSDRIYGAFKPIISASINEVGVTQAYQAMMGKYTSLPFMPSASSLDLDHYVTTKAMDGLFLQIAAEEKNIRTNPAARVTDVLKRVFGQ
ncbi:MAG TPA: DUF4197 domain-containing protein [Thermodesulfobacteriota bacterium]|nr:DUF4197 domain-containing protein [Deltaproteobacteria bacterium]HNR13044.1 DUF4197 domain-containing protein [Thermodesulfobacteriota bacterium]HNU72636.1 DUF4197 domain-containing protein [Thermodesulfobacteriota bacterium]HOC37922.1 DUF4197 domain-containing protein [Thermodesulfobacteriota bacterium]HQO78270.1 DUF4197 domain-containing protein [Thermodesulfobacteriota bacterium]